MRFPTLLIVILSFLLIFSITAYAQDTLKVSAGFSNLNVLNQNVQGWDGEVGAKLYRYDRFKLEGVAQINGHYEAGEAAYQFLGGPQLSYTVANRISPFVRGLFGTTYYEGNSFTKGIGGGVDIHIGRFFIRPAVVDFQWIDATGDIRFTRFGTGVGIRF